MKALIVLNGYSENSNNVYKAKRLTEEFALVGVSCEIHSALELLPSVTGDSLSGPFRGFDFAIDLDKDMYLAKALSLTMPLFNSYQALTLSDDKMSTLLALKGTGVQAPLTIPAPLCYIEDPKEEAIESFLNQVERELGYPLVFKECHGSMGKQVALISNREELEAVYRKTIKVPHLYEKFLAKHQGHDYRVMVVGDAVVAAMERVNKQDFRSNIAMGGRGYDVTTTLPLSFRQTALKATHALGLDYAGIDIAIGDDELPYFLEANGNAFFTEIEKVTGVNITKKLVDHIIEKLRH